MMEVDSAPLSDKQQREEKEKEIAQQEEKEKEWVEAGKNTIEELKKDILWVVREVMEKERGEEDAEKGKIEFSEEVEERIDKIGKLFIELQTIHLHTLKYKNSLDNVILQSREELEKKKEEERCLLYKKKGLLQGIEHTQSICNEPDIRQFLEDNRDIFGKEDAHNLLLTLLDSQIKQRKETEGEVVALRTQKTEIESSIARKKKALSSFHGDLKSIRDATAQFHSRFSSLLGEPAPVPSLSHTEASALPELLYTIYYQFLCYSASYTDSSLTVTTKERKSRTSRSTRSSSSSPSSSSYLDKMEGIFSPSPTYVSISFSQPKGTLEAESGMVVGSIALSPISLSLSFQHLPSPLDLVVVLSSPSSTSKSCYHFDQILGGLFPGDNGKETPNSGHHLKTTTGHFEFEARQEARPYWWAQWLCGSPVSALHPPPSSSSVSPPSSSSSSSSTSLLSSSLQKKMGMITKGMRVQVFVESMKRRIKTIQSVKAQTKLFQKGVIPLSFHPDSVGTPAIRCKVTNFADYHPSTPSYPPPLGSFTATLSLPSQIFSLTLLIPSSYPTLPPLFSLSLDGGGRGEVVGEVERVVNYMAPKLWAEGRSREESDLLVSYQFLCLVTLLSQSGLFESSSSLPTLWELLV